MPFPMQLNKVYMEAEVLNAKLPPNSQAAFFHATEQVFWIKSTDPYGTESVRKYKYDEDDSRDGTAYATLNDLAKMKDEILEAMRDERVQPTATAAAEPDPDDRQG